MNHHKTREEFFHEKVIESEIVKKEHQRLIELENEIEISKGNLKEEFFKNKTIHRITIKPIEDAIEELRELIMTGKMPLDEVIGSLKAANILENLIKKMKFEVKRKENILQKIRKEVINYVTTRN